MYTHTHTHTHNYVSVPRFATDICQSPRMSQVKRTGARYCYGSVDSSLSIVHLMTGMWNNGSVATLCTPLIYIYIYRLYGSPCVCVSLCAYNNMYISTRVFVYRCPTIRHVPRLESSRISGSKYYRPDTGRVRLEFATQFGTTPRTLRYM